MYLCLGTISFKDTHECKIESTLIAIWNHEVQTISLDLGQSLTKNQIKSDKNVCTGFDGFILFEMSLVSFKAEIELPTQEVSESSGTSTQPLYQTLVITDLYLSKLGLLDSCYLSNFKAFCKS